MSILDLIKSRSLLQQTAALLCFCVCICGFVGWYVYLSIMQVRVNGPIYEHIIQGEKLAADVRPPRLSLIEPYLVALRMAGEMDPDRLLAMLEQLKTFQADHDAANDRWLKTLSASDMDASAAVTSDWTGLITEEKAAAAGFFAAINGDFQQKILEGKSLEAKEVFDSTVTEKLNAHRAVLSRLSTRAADELTTLEASAEKDVSSRLQMMLIISASVFLVILLLTYLFVRNVTRRLKSLAAAARALSTGDIAAAEKLLNQH